MANIQEMIQTQILKAAEEQLDAEINKLDELTEDDLENIRKKRIEEMKQKQILQQQWRANVWLIFLYFIFDFNFESFEVWNVL